MASILSAPHADPGALSWNCPDCARPLAPSSGCVICFGCGYSPCG